MSLPQRRLGSQGLVVPAIGLGCMGMTAFYGTDPAQAEPESLATLDEAVSRGAIFLDTAWMYQHLETGATNEELIAKAIAKHGRDKFLIATKFGVYFTSGIGRVLDSSPQRIHEQLQQSLQRLGTDYVDLYYQHRVDPSTPIEVVAQTVKELISAGKVKYFGLSECTPDELRRAHAIQPVTAVQIEWSLQTRDVEASVVPVARELGVGIVAYSPLGRGLLSRTIKSIDDLPANDVRRRMPRFSESNFETNTLALSKLEEIAAQKNATPAQVALAWVLSRGDDVVPIPGTRHASRLVENLGALDISLTPDEQRILEDEVAAVGDRYPDMSATFNNRL